MYLDCTVDIPEVKGKITCLRRGSSSYIYYEIGRVYDPARRFTIPKRVLLGKKDQGDERKMKPNQNYLKYFPDADLLIEKEEQCRSVCLRVGTYLVIRRVLRDSGSSEVLGKYFNRRKKGMLLDFAAYAAVCRNNIGQRYSDYAFNHPLFTEKMRFCSDSEMTAFLCSITEEQSAGFIEYWIRTAAEEMPEKADSFSALRCAVENGTEGGGFWGDSEVPLHVRTLVDFVSMIICQGMQARLKGASEKVRGMTAFEAIRELERIEMGMILEDQYRFIYTLTEVQREILKAFRLDEGSIKRGVRRIIKVREGFRMMGYDGENFGLICWNPLKDFILPGNTVVLKPNMVTDVNPSGGEQTACTHIHPW